MSCTQFDFRGVLTRPNFFLVPRTKLFHRQFSCLSSLFLDCKDQGIQIARSRPISHFMNDHPTKMSVPQECIDVDTFTARLPSSIVSIFSRHYTRCSPCAEYVNLLISYSHRLRPYHQKSKPMFYHLYAHRRHLLAFCRPHHPTIKFTLPIVPASWPPQR